MKSIIEFTRHSSRALGRMRLRDDFLRGSRGPCAPGPSLLTLTSLSFFLSFFLSLNQDSQNFLTKGIAYPSAYCAETPVLIGEKSFVRQCRTFTLPLIRTAVRTERITGAEIRLPRWPTRSMRKLSEA